MKIWPRPLKTPAKPSKKPVKTLPKALRTQPKRPAKPTTTNSRRPKRPNRRGRVLPIGGIKEKLLGAVRAGIDEIIIPRDNEADLDDLREEVRNLLTIHLVEDLDQVIKVALKSDVAKKAKKKAVKTKSGVKASPSQSPAPA